jgi:hypothetical protein
VVATGIQILAVLAVGALVAIAWWLRARRRKALMAWASAHGLAYDGGRDSSFDDRHRSFGCLRRGHSRYAYNLMTGKWDGRAIEAFDYRYVTGHGKNRSTHHFSAVIVRSEIPLRPLRIRPEGLFDRVTEFFGVDDIDFESAEFSRQFHVKSADKRWAYDVLHQRTMAFLLSMPRFSLQFDEREVIAWRGRRFDAEAFTSALRVISGVLERLPPYVEQEQKGR